MRAVVQRVVEAEVRIQGESVGRIGTGLAVLLAVGEDDTREDQEFMMRKLLGLRVFNDSEGKMNLSVREVEGSLLIVSQFTLFGDCRKGNRPSFSRAAGLQKAEQMYESLAAEIRRQGVPVATGRFQAMMQVRLINDGPVTLIIDSKKEFY